MQELIKNVIRVKEQLEMDARARIFAEQRYIECVADNERLTTEVKRLLQEMEGLKNENIGLRSDLSDALSAGSASDPEIASDPS